MNITREQVDDLNAVVTVEISKEDYAGKVDQVLKDYRKNANIPGFRKGNVPMGLIQKQFGKAVLFDEVNKILQTSINDYITNEKLDILGNPLPKANNDIDWNSDELVFEFELGLAPEFHVDLTQLSNITFYDIEPDQEMVDGQLERIQKQYGKLIPQDQIESDFSFSGTFESEEPKIDNRVTLTLADFSSDQAKEALEGKKVGDQVVLNTKNLFENDSILSNHLKLGVEQVKDLDIAVNFTIDEINKIDPAELNQELFDKLFEPGSITAQEAFIDKLKEDIKAQFKQQSNQKFLNDISESLIDQVKFELPKEFLIKWIQTVGENPPSADQADQEYQKSEKGLRHQLIESKIVEKYQMQVKLDEIKSFSATLIKNQMAQFGQNDPSDQEVESIVERILANQEEVKRVSDQLMSEKMLELYNREVPKEIRKVTYKDFVKEMYGE